MRWLHRVQASAISAAPTQPAIAPRRTCDDLTWKMIALNRIAVSIPSRVIITTVNANTPSQANAPARSTERSMASWMCWRMRLPARHMWMVRLATSTAAMIASSPSHSAWFAARWKSQPATTLSTIDATTPQWTAGASASRPVLRR